MIRRVRFSPALFIACLALTVALGGVSYAAVSLPKNSVTSKQVKDHSLKKRDLASGASTIKGPRPEDDPGRPRGRRRLGRHGRALHRLGVVRLHARASAGGEPSRGRRPADRSLPVSRSSRSCRGQLLPLRDRAQQRRFHRLRRPGDEPDRRRPARGCAAVRVGRVRGRHRTRVLGRERALSACTTSLPDRLERPSRTRATAWRKLAPGSNSSASRRNPIR